MSRWQRRKCQLLTGSLHRHPLTLSWVQWEWNQSLIRHCNFSCDGHHPAERSGEIPKRRQDQEGHNRTKGWGEDMMQFRLRSMQPYLGWVHFHHFILFNNFQIFCDLHNFQLASSLHFNVTISTKCCVYELCFQRFAGTVCQQTCHHVSPMSLHFKMT